MRGLNVRLMEEEHTVLGGWHFANAHSIPKPIAGIFIFTAFSWALSKLVASE